MGRFFAMLGIMVGFALLVWIAINGVIPVFALSTGAIWSFEGMKPLADPVKAFANGVGNSVGNFVGASPAPVAPAAPAAPAATRITLIKEYPEIDPADGCTYWVRSMSDGTFPKNMLSCPVAKPAPAPAALAATTTPPQLAYGSCLVNGKQRNLAWDGSKSRLYMDPLMPEARSANQTQEVSCNVTGTVPGTVEAIGNHIPLPPGQTWNYTFKVKDPSLGFAWQG